MQALPYRLFKRRLVFLCRGIRREAVFVCRREGYEYLGSRGAAGIHRAVHICNITLLQIDIHGKITSRGLDISVARAVRRPQHRKIAVCVHIGIPCIVIAVLPGGDTFFVEIRKGPQNTAVIAQVYHTYDLIRALKHLPHGGRRRVFSPHLRHQLGTAQHDIAGSYIPCRHLVEYRERCFPIEAEIDHGIIAAEF